MGTEENEKNQSHGFLLSARGAGSGRWDPGLFPDKWCQEAQSILDDAQRMMRGGVEHTATGEAICLCENTVLLYRCAPVLMIGVGKAGRTYTENGTGMCIAVLPAQ